MGKGMGREFLQRVEPLHSLSKSEGKRSVQVPFEVFWQVGLLQLTNDSGGLQTRWDCIKVQGYSFLLCSTQVPSIPLVVPNLLQGFQGDSSVMSPKGLLALLLGCLRTTFPVSSSLLLPPSRDILVVQWPPEGSFFMRNWTLLCSPLLLSAGHILWPGFAV